MVITGTRGKAKLIRVGEFTWTDASGKEIKATFRIRTCGDINAKFADYNMQFTDTFDALCKQGISKVSYREFTPCALY